MQRIIARQTVKIDAMEELMRKTPGAFPASRSREDARWATRLTEVAQEHPEHGCRRLYEDYGRDATPGDDEYMNYKRFRRLYRVGHVEAHAALVRGT